MRATTLTLAILLVCAASEAWAHRLVLRLRDAVEATPTAARVTLTNGSVSLLTVPDPLLRTHVSGPLGNYVHAEDSLVVDVPPGFVQIRAVRGIMGVPLSHSLVVGEDVEVTLELEDWIDPTAQGWFGGDPHVHSDHDQGTEYAGATVEQAALAARAEGLHVMSLLDNDAAQPGGPVLPPAPGVTLMWGEEYRSSFWGHVVLLDLPALVLSGGQPGCCSRLQTAWPTLSETLADPSIGAALLAHPRPGDDFESTGSWPGVGIAREMRALALGDLLEGVAVFGGTNSPFAAREEYLDAIRAGARWAAIGEGDRPLDRFVVPPPGNPRTFARVEPPSSGSWEPGDPGLAAAWTAAVVARRTFASTGPLLHAVEVDGVGMGETLQLPAPATVDLRVAFDSYGAMTSLRAYGATGTHLSLEWPMGRAHLDTTVALGISHDDFVVVEIEGSGADWPQLQLPPRAISSPVWIDAGTPWPFDPAMARRGADELRHAWELSLTDRGYASPADSAAAHEDLLGAADVYEAMVDDPPPSFQLVSPPDGAVLQTLLALLQWQEVESHDGEPVQYEVTVARDAGFTDVVHQETVEASPLAVTSLDPGQRYLWRVVAHEPGDQPTMAGNAPWSLRIASTAVGAPTTGVFSLRTLTFAEGSVAYELTLPERVRPRVDVIDLRGRRVRSLQLPLLDPGVHVFRWDGRDGRGHRVSRGVYWLRGLTQHHIASTKVVLLR